MLKEPATEMSPFAVIDNEAAEMLLEAATVTLPATLRLRKPETDELSKLTACV